MEGNFTSQDTKRLHAIVHGSVQGVSFRYYTTQKARDLGITGWVRNNPDGTVEVIAEGSDDMLNALLDFLHVGSPAANVSRVAHEYLAASGEFYTFETAYFHN